MTQDLSSNGSKITNNKWLVWSILSLLTVLIVTLLVRYSPDNVTPPSNPVTQSTPADGQIASVLQLRQRDGKVVLSGFLPDQASIESVVRQTQSLYEPNTVVNQLSTNTLASKPTWLANFTSLVATLYGVDKLTLNITDSNIHISGRVETEQARTLLMQQARAHFGDQLTESITVKTIHISPEALAIKAATKLAEERRLAIAELKAVAEQKHIAYAEAMRLSEAQRLSAETRVVSLNEQQRLAADAQSAHLTEVQLLQTQRQQLMVQAKASRLANEQLSSQVKASHLANERLAAQAEKSHLTNQQLTTQVKASLRDNKQLTTQVKESRLASEKLTTQAKSALLLKQTELAEARRLIKATQHQLQQSEAERLKAKLQIAQLLKQKRLSALAEKNRQMLTYCETKLNQLINENPAIFKQNSPTIRGTSYGLLGLITLHINACSDLLRQNNQYIMVMPQAFDNGSDPLARNITEARGTGLITYLEQINGVYPGLLRPSEDNKNTTAKSQLHFKITQ